QWIAMRYVKSQEDIVICRIDGKEMRKLTDDRFKDRGPRWSPDGKRILFYSDRSGRYEAWSIAPDGSGLTQMTETTGRSHWYPVWSHDGKKIAFSNAEGVSIADVSGTLPTRDIQNLPPLPEGTFMATSWSTDGKFLAGGALKTAQNRGVYIYSFD